MPTNFFGSLRPKFFARKTWYPLLYMKLFDTPTFLKHWMDAHRKFRHSETKSFLRKNVLPFIRYKNFRYPNFSETLKGCPQNFSAPWDQKISPERCDTPCYVWIFSLPPNYLNHWRMPTKFVGSLRPKFFAGKTWYTLLYMKLFDTPTFPKHWTEAHRKFRHSETKSFLRKNVIPFIMYKIFPYPKFSETLKGCAQIYSPLWDKKVSTEKCDILYHA